jgi:hypothetical protein
MDWNPDGLPADRRAEFAKAGVIACTIMLGARIPK